jgi:hypothetical protein
MSFELTVSVFQLEIYITYQLLIYLFQEMAVSERRRQQLSSSSSHHREISGYLTSHRSLDIGSEELYHQQVLPYDNSYMKPVMHGHLGSEISITVLEPYRKCKKRSLHVGSVSLKQLFK